MFCTTHNEIRASVLTPSCLDTLGAGALLALLWHRGLRDRALQYRRPLLTAGIIAAITIIILKAFDVPMFRGRITFTALSYAAVYFWLVDAAAHGFSGVVGRVLQNRVLVYLGKISYGIYVFHEFVPEYVKWLRSSAGVNVPFPEEEGFARFGAVLLCTLILASLSWHTFERPLNDLKRYFPYPNGRRGARPKEDGAEQPAAETPVGMPPTEIGADGQEVAATAEKPLV